MSSETTSRRTLETTAINAYVKSRRTLDDLPYTEDFDQLFAVVSEEHPEATRRAVLHCLANARKGRRVPRKTGLRSAAPLLGELERAALCAAVTKEVGSIGARDQLPYSPTFDRVAMTFTEETGIVMTSHELWLAIAHLGKNPHDRPSTSAKPRRVPARRVPSSRTLWGNVSEGN